ncbi:NAD(P)-binding domain-containing protein [Pseudonocardia sp. S2-4]|uniref:NAD(P)-binding domain-containing protein n=1 Tax=Pseudonocardia humida TaxID=2800819 RepID=A0ABT1ABA6_9PSEU|nr:NAD(P)-binding domain-containing protein [Pseudonocardia humida]
MTWGTIGAGEVAQAVARHAVRAGHEVVLSNSRGPESLESIVAAIGPGASAGTVAQAAEADLVLLAVPWTAVPAALRGLPRRDGRIVIDATNQMASITQEPVIDDLGDQTGSELVASLVPGARVIKAFNTLYGRYIAPDPRHDAGRQLLFYAGDDLAAKSLFHDVVHGFGFAPVDIGRLREGGRLMQVGGGPLSALHALRQDFQ